MNTFGRRVWGLRKERELTQTDVADIIRKRGVPVTAAHVSLIETGKRNPSVPLLTELAVLLETSTDYLLGLTGDREPVREVDDVDGRISVLEREVSSLNRYLVMVMDVMLDKLKAEIAELE